MLYFCGFQFLITYSLISHVPGIMIFIHYGFDTAKKRINYKFIIMLYIFSICIVYLLSLLLLQIIAPLDSTSMWVLFLSLLPAIPSLGIWFFFLYIFSMFEKKFIKNHIHLSLIGQIVIFGVLILVSVGYVTYNLDRLKTADIFERIVTDFVYSNKYSISEVNNKLNSISNHGQTEQIEEFIKTSIPELHFMFDLKFNRIQNYTKLAFLYLERKKKCKTLYETVYNRLHYDNQRKFFYCLFYNSMPKIYDFSRLLKFKTFSESTVKIPDLQQYAQNKYSDEKLFSLMKRFLKNLIDYHEFEMYAYLLLIDLNYQEGNIKEAIEYYNTAVSLKIPENFPAEISQNSEFIRKKIIEIYKPLLNEK